MRGLCLDGSDCPGYWMARNTSLQSVALRLDLTNDSNRPVTALAAITNLGASSVSFSAMGSPQGPQSWNATLGSNPATSLHERLGQQHQR